MTYQFYIGGSVSPGFFDGSYQDELFSLLSSDEDFSSLMGEKPGGIGAGVSGEMDEVV